MLISLKTCSDGSIFGCASSVEEIQTMLAKEVNLSRHCACKISPEKAGECWLMSMCYIMCVPTYSYIRMVGARPIYLHLAEHWLESVSEYGDTEAVAALNCSSGENFIRTLKIAVRRLSARARAPVSVCRETLLYVVELAMSAADYSIDKVKLGFDAYSDIEPISAAELAEFEDQEPVLFVSDEEQTQPQM